VFASRDASPASSDGIDLPGVRIDYVELPSLTAHELTRAFCAKAFGWTFTDYGPNYSATTTGDVDVGLNGQAEDALAAPLPVVRVKDLEATLEAVIKAGGTIARPIFAFPEGRRFHFIDPSGSELAVWQPAD
jgi:predicted enzyme related to lactoylglutathione lyase